MANSHGTDASIYEGLAAPYGSLDSACLRTNTPHDAAILRQMARCSNRIAATGHSLFQFVWDADPARATTPSVAGVNKAFLRDHWYQMTRPITVPKKPGLTSGEVQGWISTDDAGTIIKIQVTTIAAPYRDNVAIDTSPATNNVVEIVGTGSFTPQLFTLSGITLDPGPFESIAIYVTGYKPGGDALGDTVTYGTPNTGSDGQLRDGGVFESGGASWNVPPTASWGSGGHYIVFSPGSLGATPFPVGKFQIVNVTSSTELIWTAATNAPKETYNAGGFIEGTIGYTIYQYPKVNLQSVAMYAVDRTY